jgi:hypothetical protein
VERACKTSFDDLKLDQKQAWVLVRKAKSLILERSVEDMKKVLVVAVALTLILSASAFAGANVGVAKMAVHVDAHMSRSCAKAATMPVINSCADIVTTAAGYNVDAFPVMFDLVEYQGFDYGLMFNSPYSAVFTSCSPLTIGGVVWPGDGVSHAWYTCQPGPIVIPGFIWAYSYGMICPVPHPIAGGPQVGDCQGVLDPFICIFCAGTNGFVGDDPCEPTDTEQNTWGSIKGMFE